MAYSTFTINGTNKHCTVYYDIKETNVISFRLRTTTSATAETLDFAITDGGALSIVGTNFDNVNNCYIDIILPSEYNNADYNAYFFYSTTSQSNVNSPCSYNTTRLAFTCGSPNYNNANPFVVIKQSKYINGVNVETSYKRVTDDIKDNYLSLGNHTITLTADNYFSEIPIAIYNGNTHRFTLSQDKSTATLEIDIDTINSVLAISATAILAVPFVYDFDDNIDFYLTDSQGNIIEVNPQYITGNEYIRGYFQTKNDAIFVDTPKIQKLRNGAITNIFASVNTEQNKATVSDVYVAGDETSFTFIAESEIVSGVDVVQNLSNCVSSVSTLRLALGSHAITLTANNDTVFNTPPTANYNNVDYTFTLNNDSTIATLEIVLDVADITLTITGSASVTSLQGISNFYKPTLDELQYISNHRYKWLSGEYSSERIDLGDYILNLKTVFTPLTVRTTEKVILGGNELNIFIHPLNATFIDFTTPDVMIYGYYRNGFDIKNITSFYAMIPFYGIYELDREYINKNIRFSFHIDLSNCNVEIGVYVDNKLTETLSGDCSIDIPYIMEKSLTPKTECFTEHLKIVVNEKTNCNNRIKTIKNDLISNFTGFIKGDVITDSIKATANELDLLKQLFNEGVYNG